MEQPDMIIEDDQPYVIKELPPEVSDKRVQAIMIMDVISLTIMIASYNSFMSKIIECTDIVDLLAFNPMILVIPIITGILKIARIILVVTDCIALYKIKKLKVMLVVHAILFRPLYIWYRAKALKRDMKPYYVYVAILTVLMIWFFKDFYVTVSDLTDKIISLMDNGGFQFDPYEHIMPNIE